MDVLLTESWPLQHPRDRPSPHLQPDPPAHPADSGAPGPGRDATAADSGVFADFRPTHPN